MYNYMHWKIQFQEKLAIYNYNLIVHPAQGKEKESVVQKYTYEPSIIFKNILKNKSCLCLLNSRSDIQLQPSLI